MLLPPKKKIFSKLTNEERLDKDNTDMHKKYEKSLT